MLRVDLSGLNDFSRALKAAQPELSKEFGKRLSAAGELVAGEARIRSSWSKRIPKSIKTRRSNLTIRVVAGSADAPHAAPIEHGGNGGTFRHPVFGNRDIWVAQKARPFLNPALISRQDDAVKAAIDAIDYAFGRAGFR